MSRRGLSILVGLLLATAGLVTVDVRVPDATAATAGTDDPLTDSAVTVNGRSGIFGDDFTGLRITVAQTKELTSQGIVVSWTGGRPSAPRDDDPAATNYLQFMQCWGPDPKAANFRETCQVGGSSTPARAPSPVDPRCPTTDGKPCESLPPDAQMVPFRPANGSATPHGGAQQPWPRKACGPPEDNLTCPATEADILADHYSVYTTNEITKAVTAGDGTGRAVFEVQTAVESPHLGCGAPGHLTCWLVIVPRGERDRAGNPTVQVEGSPLGASVFSDALAVPLGFQPVGAFCPLGRAERRTTGSELVANAMLSWQPALCADDGPVFGYSTTGDDDAARQVLTPGADGPGLAFTSDPVVPPPGGPAVVHAPVVLSAVVIAFNIDFRIDPGATDSRAGTMVRELNLTPRLVAKLLTQSYKRDIPGSNQPKYEYLAGNPRTIRLDKEFLAANPQFASYASNAAFDGLMVSIGTSAAAREVWRWILADPDARAWLGGKADENGMVVNKEYLPLFATAAAPTSFPREDLNCDTPPKQEKYCALDLRPYQGSLAEAGYQTLRADAKNRTWWDPAAFPMAYKAFPPQPVTQRFAAAVTDAATAARYGLFTARLRNRAGEFVAPTEQSVLAAASALVPSGTPGVRKIDPDAVVPGAYPLGMLTYAVGDTTDEPAARRDYATLIRYAVAAGQISGVQRGQLPRGYVPLPAQLRAEALTAAAALQQAAPTPAPTSTAPPGPDGAAPPPVAPGTATSGVPVAGAPPVAAPPTRLAPTRPSGTPVAQVTRGQPAGAIRFVLLGALLLGAAAALAGPLVRLVARRRGVTS
ncbi:hypothetical protein [Micromonospora sp. NPDC092111]|uniref:hypothetical protein n=1 Tax=Micromonospora sp. NPDC092111 TaxID=3364289 RepID=UPI00381EAE67